MQAFLHGAGEIYTKKANLLITSVLLVRCVSYVHSSQCIQYHYLEGEMQE